MKPEMPLEEAKVNTSSNLSGTPTESSLTHNLCLDALMDQHRLVPANDPELIELSLRVLQADGWKKLCDEAPTMDKDENVVIFGRPVLQTRDGVLEPRTDALQPEFLPSGNIRLHEVDLDLAKDRSDG
jgi:hypothetical protein